MSCRLRALLPGLVLSFACADLTGVPTPGLAAATDAAPASAILRVAVSGNAPGRVISTPPGIDCPGACEASFARGTRVVLDAEAASGAQFTGWRGGASREVVLADAEVEQVAMFHRPHNVAFVTSATWKGDLGGLAGADQRCNQAAAEAALPAGPYVAFLADGTADVASRLVGTGWVRPDGRTVAVSAADLLAGQLFYPPRLDEHGVDRGTDPVARAFVGRHGDRGIEDDACLNWTVSTSDELAVQRAAVGSLTGGSHTWAEIEPIGCGDAARLYCFGNDPGKPAPPPPPAPAFGTRIWVSSARLTPGSGPTPDALCDAEAMAHPPLVSSLALAAASGAAPMRMLESTVTTCTSAGELVRADGAVVARHPADLWRERGLAAAIDRQVDGSLVAPGTAVWLGAPGFAVAGTATCADWTSSAGKGLVHEVGSTLPATRLAECSEAHPVLCFEYVVACH